MTRRRHKSTLWDLLPVADGFFLPPHSPYFCKFSKFHFHNTKALFLKTTVDSCLEATTSYLREWRQPSQRARRPPRGD